MLSTIPSPVQGVWHLGPIPLRGYALCILVGIGIAIVVGQRRWKERGGDPVVVVDVATWAVPFGVVGGRLYHVITSPSAYFGSGGHPMDAFKIWEGGLGIWGAVILGGVGAWIGCRRNGVKLPPYGDAIAPGILFAQALGRWGNWFNNELYGERTSKPWGLKIYEWDSSTGHAVRDAAGHPVVLGFFQPTFLYESIWDILAAIAVIWADRRFKLGHGRVFALYVVIYSVGRGAIETLRIDQADHILGLRLNVWTSIVVFLGGLTYFIVSTRLRPGREAVLTRAGVETEPDSDSISGSEELSKRIEAVSKRTEALKSTEVSKNTDVSKSTTDESSEAADDVKSTDQAADSSGKDAGSTGKDAKATIEDVKSTSKDSGSSDSSVKNPGVTVGSSGKTVEKSDKTVELSTAGPVVAAASGSAKPTTDEAAAPPRVET